MSCADVFFSCLFIIGILISIYSFVDSMREKKRGVIYRNIQFTSVKEGFPPKVYGRKDSVSEPVIVYLEAGPIKSKQIKFSTDTYDYDLERWTTHWNDGEGDFVITKWAPLPKE